MASKKVLFLEINSSYSHSMLSYGMIRAYVEELVPEWQWFHTEATVKNSVTDIAAEVSEYSPDVVLATGYIFNITVLLTVCDLIKKQLPETAIILGGPTFLGDNQTFLRDNPQISGVIRGDESSVPELLNSTGRNIEHIPGYCWIADGVYADNGTALFDGELDQLPSPFQSNLITADKPFVQLETSRGCNGNCQFCTSSVSDGVKYFSLERCRTDLQAIGKSGINEVRLIDRTFNERPGRAIALLDMFREEFPAMKFHLEVNPAKLSDKVLERLELAPAGQLHIEVGIQSLNPQVLCRIKRPASVEGTLDGLTALLAIKRFELHADLIAGLPEQKIDDVLKDVEKLMTVGPHEIQLENLKLLPGTALRRDLPSGYKFNPQPLWEVTETPEMSSADLVYAARLSYVIDSWYNTPQLHKCWRFAFNIIPGMLVDFCDFVKDKITLNSGKLPLEKRFILLEEFCQDKSAQAAELCRFTMIANGFVYPEFKTVKAVGDDMENYQSIWKLTENHQIRRYITMKCSFNAGDFFAGLNNEIIEDQYCYIFKLYYGRNVAEIVYNT
jgi:radical SAM superfamily enzyme YgiQ (UPF0313 family)